MARVFVSHASADNEIAKEIEGHLQVAGHQVFLDSDMRTGLRVGQNWMQRLYAELCGADAVVCLVSSSLGSRWCGIEVALAQERDAPIIPLSVGSSMVVDPLLGALHHLNYTADPTAALTHVVGVLSGPAVGGAGRWSDDENPFPGLRAFDKSRRAGVLRP